MTIRWYQESAIEAFMRSNHPAEFRQDWVSYAGTGRNIFGGATLYGHGRPGAIVLLKPEVIADYCRSSSETEKRRLYDVFASGDEEKIRELVDHIRETIMQNQRSPNQTVQRTGASRFAPRQIERQWRLAPIADLFVRRKQH